MGDAIVGRRPELNALRGWLDAARQGSGRLVLCAGEPGIGKTRLAQEFAGMALAGGSGVAWGRCVEADGAPALWPWRQVLRSLDRNVDHLLAADVDSPEDRFEVLDRVSEAVSAAASGGALAVILDDVHRADEPSLLVLRHLGDRIPAARLLVLATFRDVEPGGSLPRVLPDLVRLPAVERLDLRGFDLGEVREELLRATGRDSAEDARRVLDVTGGNPLFVREVARAMADGTWKSDRPPRTVLDVVASRLDRVSGSCRRLVQAAAVAGRDFTVPLVARALDQPLTRCLPLVDEAIAYGLVDRVGDMGEHRFVHALTREAVEASLTTADRLTLHRAVAVALAEEFAGELSEHLADIARHWAALAPYGEAETARAWAIRAADDAVSRLAYEEGVRLYRGALAFPASPLPDAEHARVLVSLGRAAHLAGDVHGSVEAAVAAADVAERAGSPELISEAALVLEAVPDRTVNAVTEQLCDRALAAVGERGREGVRARLLAQRSHLAFYDGAQHRVEALSAAALDLARASGDDRSLGDALRARKEACPGPAGRAERILLAGEMLELAKRTDTPRAAMWAALWRIDALVESGQLAAASDELAELEVAVRRVGGPVSAWHLARAGALVAQAQGRFNDAAAIARRGFDRMRAVEPRPAMGAYVSLQVALARHVGVSDELAELASAIHQPLPRFRTVGPLVRSFMLVCAGAADEAAASYQQAGPVDSWSVPASFFLHGHVTATLVAAELSRHDDLVVLLDRLEPFRGEHAVGESVCSMGPVDLALGRGEVVLGRLDRAVGDLATAVDLSDLAGARGFAAEARYHLATALLARDAAGDADRARAAARDALRLARALGMTAYVGRAGALVAHLEGSRPPALSARETEVARLVAEGLTNRQIAERLVISERTAQNHVQHILTKLGFTTRSQIAAWTAGVGR